jgi:hypothetical protein
MVAFTAEAQELEEAYTPDISLHFNMKDDDSTLSPQYKLPDEVEAKKNVQADIEYDLILGYIGRNPVNVGEWGTEAAAYAQEVTITEARLFYDEDGSSDDNGCVWTFTVKLNDQEVEEVERDCQGEHDPEEDNYQREETFPIEVNFSIQAGDYYSIDLTYEGWEDITIFYDNISYDSGYAATTTPLSFYGAQISGGTVTIEFTEAWPVDWKNNLKGNYVMLMGMDSYTADNDQASVSEGAEHTMTNGTVVTGTVITWNGVTGKELNVMLHYTQFNHMANGSVEGPLETLGVVASSGPRGDDSGILGLPSFQLLLAVPAFAWVARRR